MISKIYNDVVDLILITGKQEVLWIVLPLILATIIILVYFEKYRDERPGWNTHVSNSLVLLFVSLILLRYVFNLEGGLVSYITYLNKTVLSLGLLVIGIIILFLNFEHFLTEKMATYISSPLTLNLIAYIIILLTYSSLDYNFTTLLAGLILFILLFAILHLVKIPLFRFFRYMRRLKEREKRDTLIQDKKPIQEKKKELKKEEKIIRRAKKEVKREEKTVKKGQLKELNKQKNDAIKLKRVVKR